MLDDIRAVLWKELREIAFPNGRLLGGAKNVYIIIGIAGVLFPLQTGTAWLTSWLSIYSACFPVILVVNYTADSIAGERERNTLETLLASRLDTRAILLGKVLAVTLYGWSLVLLCQPVAVLALNLVHRGHGLLFYRPAILLSIVVLGLVVALAVTSVGAIVSLTAPTVRVAGQRMLIPFLALLLLPAALQFLVRRLHWESAVAALEPASVVAGVAAFCLLLAGAALLTCMRRFTRERVVLA